MGYSTVFPILKHAEAMPSEAPYAVKQYFDDVTDALRERKITPEFFLPMEPQLTRSNAFSKSLQTLLKDPKVSRHSAERLGALRKIGPEIEQYAREILGNEKLKIVLVPGGSVLRGYAGLFSDVENDLYFLDEGTPNFYGIDTKDELKIGNRIKELLEREGYEDGGWAQADRHSMVNLLDANTFPESADFWLTLFLPVAYGDEKLIELARKRAIAAIGKKDGIKWVDVRRRHQSYLAIPIDKEYEIIDKPHLALWLSRQNVDPSLPGAIEAFNKRWLRKVGLPNLSAMKRIYISGPASGLEETIPTVLPGQSVQEIVGQQGGMVPGASQQVAGRFYANRPEVQQALRTNEGRLKLTAEVAGKLTGRTDVLGGLLIAGSAADLPDEDFMVIADSDLNNPAAQRVLAWIPGGSDSRHVAKTLGLLKAGPHQLALFEEEPGLTSERVQALITENLGSTGTLRSVVGIQEQVRALPVNAFKVLGRMKGLPDVVFLGLAFTFKDQYD